MAEALQRGILTPEDLASHAPQQAEAVHSGSENIVLTSTATKDQLADSLLGCILGEAGALSPQTVLLD